MRRVLLILALTVLTISAGASDVFAQRRGGGGGRRGGGRVYSGRNYGNYGYRNYGYGRGYYGNGLGYYGGLGYFGGGLGYYGGGLGYYGGGLGYYGGYGSPYYGGSNYYYSDPVIQVSPGDTRQSFYNDPSISQQSAIMSVLVPLADATVWFDGTLTNQQGMERTFTSPPLEPGTYVYTIRARWMENGQAVERERRVSVQPGQTLTIDFRRNSVQNGQ